LAASAGATRNRGTRKRLVLAFVPLVSGFKHNSLLPCGLSQQHRGRRTTAPAGKGSWDLRIPSSCVRSGSLSWTRLGWGFCRQKKRGKERERMNHCWWSWREKTTFTRAGLCGPAASCRGRGCLWEGLWGVDSFVAHVDVFRSCRFGVVVCSEKHAHHWRWRKINSKL